MKIASFVESERLIQDALEQLMQGAIWDRPQLP